MRAAITGRGLISSLGNSVDDTFHSLLNQESGVREFPEWRNLVGLRSFVGAPAKPFDISKISRSKRRGMSRMSEMATVATFQATEEAGLRASELGRRGILILGSTTGSPAALESYFKKYFERGGPEGQLSTSFFKVMNHSVASNVAVALDYLGPQLGLSSACSTSSQAMALGWELISAGIYDVVIAGGADELHPMTAAVFDTVEAASRGFNERPHETPRPFDIDRDGLAVSEGASVAILESEKHAKSRGAPIFGYLEGAAYLCDGSHMSQPRQPSMVACMRQAIEQAGMSSDQIAYINAHATGTLLGDIEEARGICELFGSNIPVSGFKGNFGHSMAACGALEAILSLEMMRRGVLLPTKNLVNPDPECRMIRLPMAVQEQKIAHCLSNNFAFGGMNTALVLSPP